MVPYPFSRGLFLWGPPLWVPQDGNEAQLEATREELERLLNRLTIQAQEVVNQRRG